MCDQSSLVDLCTQDYKFRCAALTICATWLKPRKTRPLQYFDEPIWRAQPAKLTRLISYHADCNRSNDNGFTVSHFVYKSCKFGVQLEADNIKRNINKQKCKYYIEKMNITVLVLSTLCLYSVTDRKHLNREVQQHKKTEQTPTISDVQDRTDRTFRNCGKQHSWSKLS